MKLVLVGINSKYVHTNLAVRYLKNVAQSICDTQICEYSINDSVFSVERDLILRNPDIIAFSCYIWNIDFILNLSSDIKKAVPECKIILGGPEVSFNATDVLKENKSVDFIVKGEGELSFPQFLKDLNLGKDDFKDGIVYRRDDEIIDTPLGFSPQFSEIPFPYSESDDLGNKIVYYETSRGCPYSCKYCLSGEGSKVRYKDIDEVINDLDFFDKNKVSLVKFVDRTFNADRKRALQIWRHIAKLKGNTRFHMEIGGELIDDDAVSALKSMDCEKIQFEIGVQSTNEKTLAEINRKSDLDKLFANIKKLRAQTDIHIHLDLIAGLPYEDFDSFKKSFNDVFSLNPSVLQLGFLKVLKGSKMHSEAQNHSIIYRDYPPYEVISTKYISCEEILFLKDFEYLFDKVYNSGSFCRTVEYLKCKNDDFFSEFSLLVNKFRDDGLIGKPISKHELFCRIYDCYSSYGEEFEFALRYDYILSLKPGNMPVWAKTDKKFRFSESVYDFLKNEEIKKEIMPVFFDVPAKEIIKRVRFERIGTKTYAFDYKTDEVYDVSKYFK